MGRKHLTRKQILHYEEPMVRWVKRLYHALIQHYVPILIGLGVLLAAGFAWTVWQSHRMDITQTTGSQLTVAVMDLQKLLSDPPADKDDFHKQARELADRFTEIINTYPMTPAAHQAMFQLAQLYLFRQHFDQAETYFRKAQDLPYPLKDMARFGLVQALAGSKKFDEAIKELQNLRDDKNRSLGDDWLDFQEAQILLQRGDKEKARYKLENIIKKDKDSVILTDARNLLEQLQSEPKSPPSHPTAPEKGVKNP